MSRNKFGWEIKAKNRVTPREGRVSRNIKKYEGCRLTAVTPREGRVSRNSDMQIIAMRKKQSRPARGV